MGDNVFWTCLTSLCSVKPHVAASSMYRTFPSLSLISLPPNLHLEAIHKSFTNASVLMQPLPLPCRLQLGIFIGAQSQIYKHRVIPFLPLAYSTFPSVMVSTHPSDAQCESRPHAPRFPSPPVVSPSLASPLLHLELSLLSPTRHRCVQ